MPFTTSEANTLLNWMLGKTSALSGKGSVYIGLLTNDPEDKDDAGIGVCNEIKTSDVEEYHRVLLHQFNNDAVDLIGNADGRVIKNKAQINWTKAKSDWPLVKGIALYTAKSGGSPFYYAKLKNPLSVEKDAVALFEKDQLQIGFKDTDEDIEVTITT